MSEEDQSLGASAPNGGGLIGWVKRLSGRRGEEEAQAAALDDLFSARARDGDDSGAAHERVLVDNILKLRDLTAYDVMVPRAEIVAAPENASLDELLALIAEKPHSRVPIYRGTLDEAIGIVHFKDLVAVARSEEMRRSFSAPKMLRPLPFIAPSIRVMDLLHEMRRDRTHLALVVDEHGGVDGLITIEDVVETIVGEIEDEHDRDGVRPAQIGADGSVLADARMELTDFEEAFCRFRSDEELEEDIDTLGGLVFALAGRVPGRGELIEHPSGTRFEVVAADPRRILSLRVRGLPLSAAEAVDPPRIAAQA